LPFEQRTKRGTGPRRADGTYARYIYQVLTHCSECGKELLKYPSEIARGEGRRCRRCAQKASGRLWPKLAPLRPATHDDFVWAAGFLEGEGTFGRSTTEVVAAGQKQRWPLDRLRAAFGGSVKRHRNTSYYDWRVTGARARGLMMSLYGMLSPRRQEQVLRALR
jgi:DNA-directed RNA polymerase subunit RPC12/RpoP